MLDMAEIESDRGKAVSLLKTKLDDGSAYRKFVEMVEYQGGDLSIFADPTRLPKATVVTCLKAGASGFVAEFDTEAIGRLIVEMGGGRLKKDDVVDPLVGLVFRKKLGEGVRASEILVEIHARDEVQAELAIAKLDSYILIGDEKAPMPELIKKRLS